MTSVESRYLLTSLVKSSHFSSSIFDGFYGFFKFWFIDLARINFFKVLGRWPLKILSQIQKKSNL